MPFASTLLTKEDVREKLNLASTRGVDQLMRARKIRFLVLGHRTVRFEESKLMEDLQKFELKAVQ